MIIYILRHRLSYSDTGRISDKGLAEAELLASFFKKKNFKSGNVKIITSYVQRCVDSIKPTANLLSLKVVTEGVFAGYYDEDHDWCVNISGSFNFLSTYKDSKILIVCAHHEHVYKIPKKFGDFKKSEAKSNFGGEMVRIDTKKKTFTYYV